MRGRRGGYAREAAIKHIKEFYILSSRIGPILDDILGIFFALTPQSLDELLAEYGKQFSAKAERYARDTYGLWKTGQRKIAGQTAERLINLIPPYLDFTDRYALVKKLCAHCAKKQHHEITVNAESPSESLVRLKTILDHCCCLSTEKYIPDEVLDTMRWLNNDDMVASRMILAEIDKETHKATAEIAVREFDIVSRAVRDKIANKATHTIVLPTASITVNIERPRRGIFARIMKSIFGG